MRINELLDLLDENHDKHDDVKQARREQEGLDVIMEPPPIGCDSDGDSNASDVVITWSVAKLKGIMLNYVGKLRNIRKTSKYDKQRVTVTNKADMDKVITLGDDSDLDVDVEEEEEDAVSVILANPNNTNPEYNSVWYKKDQGHVGSNIAEFNPPMNQFNSKAVEVQQAPINFYLLFQSEDLVKNVVDESRRHTIHYYSPLWRS